MPADTAPAGRNEQIDAAVTIDVAEADCIETEGVFSNALRRPDLLQVSKHRRRLLLAH